eukprot:334818-Prymnesium_polylepis.1
MTVVVTRLGVTVSPSSVAPPMAWILRHVLLLLLAKTHPSSRDHAPRWPVGGAVQSARCPSIPTAALSFNPDTM